MRTSLLVTWGVRLILAYSLGCVIIRICRWTKGGLILVQVSSSLSKKVPKTKFLRLSHLYLLTCPTFFYILSILSRVLTKNDQVLCWNWGCGNVHKGRPTIMDHFGHTYLPMSYVFYSKPITLVRFLLRYLPTPKSDVHFERSLRLKWYTQEMWGEK